MEKARSALWVHKYYHWVAKTLGLEQDLTSGQFTEKALDEYINKNFPERKQEFYIKRKEFDELARKADDDEG